MTKSEAINCDGKCTNCSNTELPNIKDCKEMDIGYSYAYKTDCTGDRYIKAEEVKYLLKLERDKAIDDYMNKLCNHCMKETNECNKLKCPFCTDGCDIVKIAEQLKVGGENEQR